MGIRLNEDKEIVATIREGLKAKGGYCPCRLQRIEDNKCICKEFREQIVNIEDLLEKNHVIFDVKCILPREKVDGRL